MICVEKVEQGSTPGIVRMAETLAWVVFIPVRSTQSNESLELSSLASKIVESGWLPSVADMVGEDKVWVY